MGIFTPGTPSYDVAELEAASLHERLRLVCQSWAVQGYGTPAGVYLVYVAKLGLYVGLWAWWVSFSDTTGPIGDVGSWWLSEEAFRKAVVWTVAFEGLGMASGSGPLTGRYVPPIGGAVYFLRPGTLKVPLLPGVPVVGRDTRSLLDVAAYLAHHALLVRVLVAPAVTAELVLPVLGTLLLLGLLDKTAFLAHRPDHYLAVLVVFLADAWLPASKWIWFAVWFWAATSKLNRHFPAVVATMTSNAPTTGFGGLRTRLYRGWPDDLRPSPLARTLAHGGTVVEYAFPRVLLLGDGGPATVGALVVMFAFHAFITSAIPMGVPIEWNLMMVYGGVFLFGHHADVPAWGLGNPWLALALVVSLLVVPLVGNLVPQHVSFLMSMRYYAGNWAWSIWLFRDDAMDRLDEHLVKPSKVLPRQLAVLYDDATIRAVLPKVMAFRAMHLHGRALGELVPRAADDPTAYDWLDGELLAGQVVGWNFGEGHLHREQTLRAVQRRCAFEPGELRVLMVESQPMHRPTMHWRIHDAATGLVEEGHLRVADLVDRQPWDPPSGIHGALPRPAGAPPVPVAAAPAPA